MSGKLTKGDLRQRAREEGLDADQSYEALREAITIHECKWCGDEYLDDLWDGFCTDACQVHYINEYHRP